MKNLILTCFFLMIGFTAFSQNSNSLLDTKTVTILEKIIEIQTTNSLVTNLSLTCNLTPIKTNTLQLKNSSAARIRSNTKDFFRKFFGRNPIHLTVIDVSKNNNSIFPGESADA